MSEPRLAGRTALVTGAGRGIGRAIARRMLEDGARVVIADRDEDAGRDAADEYRALGEVRFAATDVADEASVARAVEQAVATFGGLDIVVNNAALADPETGPIAALERAVWDRYLAVNLTGPMLVCKHAASVMTGLGAIINVASTRALQSEPNTEAYAASKGGLVALTHALAVSLGPIRVNCVLPGWIATAAWAPRGQRQEPALSAGDHAQHPAGRVGRPEDVASLCAWLASDEAGFVTGASYVIDGGMTRAMIYRE